jgi:hypothetical protein
MLHWTQYLNEKEKSEVSMIKSKMLLVIGILLLFSISVSAQENQQEQQDQNNQDQQNQNPDQEKVDEYNQITQRLRTVQQQALSDIEIAKKTNEFSAKVDSEMVRQDPLAHEKLEQRNDIVDNYEAAEKTGDSAKMEEIRRKFQSLSQELIALQQKALQKDELRQEGEKLEKAVLDKMTDIDPEVPKLIARLETLGSELQNYDQNNQ